MATSSKSKQSNAAQEAHAVLTNRMVDNGQPLTQELLNSIMREPGGNPRASGPVLPACPHCGERYCGDGTQLCAECVAPDERHGFFRSHK